MKARLLLLGAALAAVGALSPAGPGRAAAPPADADPDADVQDVVVLGDAGPLLLRLRIRLEGRPLRTTWAAAVGKVFDYLDVNCDGSLDAREAAAAPSAQVLFGRVVASGRAVVDWAGPAPAALDADGDGKVSRAELADYYRRAGKLPLQFRYADVSANAINRRLFELLDADKDGRLSRKELAAAPKVLAKADADDDEVVTLAEVMGTANPNAEDEDQVPSRAFDPSGKLASAAVGPFYVVTSARPDKALVKTLLGRYAPKGAKALTRKASGLAKPAFDRLDEDGDGTLDAEELARFALRPPDLEVAVRLDDRGKAVEVVKKPGAALAKAVKPVKGGGVELALGTTRVTLGGPVPYGGVLLLEVFFDWADQFKAADKDNNGYLDAKEARGNLWFREVFAVMDRDGDGKLYLKEALAYLDAVEDLRKAAVAGCASLIVSDQGRGLFDLADADGDGRLSVRELRSFAKVVGKLDRDGDGAVSPREVPRRYRAPFHKGPPTSYGGGFRTVNDNPTPPAPAPREGPVWFRKMDRNRDGDVSRKEFLGTDAEFRKADADGDGLISPKEAAAYDERLRKAKKKD